MLLPRTLPLLALVLMLLVACGSGSARESTQDLPGAERRVFIDPETGELTQPPPGADIPVRAQRRSADDRQSWMIDGPDGTRMLIHDRRDWPQLNAERDADGGFDIGHGGAAR